MLLKKAKANQIGCELNFQSLSLSDLLKYIHLNDLDKVFTSFITMQKTFCSKR